MLAPDLAPVTLPFAPVDPLPWTPQAIGLAPVTLPFARIEPLTLLAPGLAPVHLAFASLVGTLLAFQ
jgi:hypothetical protein